MLPKIKKDKFHFVFDALLRQEELSLLKNYIGKKISYLLLEHLNLSLKPKIRIACKGKCNFQFAGNQFETKNLQFIAHYVENRTIPSQGGISLHQIISKYKKGIESILHPPHTIENSFVIKIDYPNKTPLTAIQFYGHQMNTNIRTLEGWADEKYYKKIGYETFPTVDCNSIEFIVFVHENNLKTIISIDTDGFWFHLNYNGNIDEAIISKSYVRENGYFKNIILQQEIT